MLFRDQVYFISIFCITNNTRSGKLIFKKHSLRQHLSIFVRPVNTRDTSLILIGRCKQHSAVCNIVCMQSAGVLVSAGDNIVILDVSTGGLWQCMMSDFSAAAPHRNWSPHH